MSYSSRTYEHALAELERRRDKSLAEQKKRHDEAVKKLPELLEIEREMSATGLAVVKAIGMGGDAQSYIDNLAKQNLAAQEKRRKLLASAGFSHDYLEIHHVCKSCNDTGFLNGKLCECHKSLLRSIAFSDLSELSPAETSTFESFKLEFYPKGIDPDTGISPYTRMKEIYNFCKEYAEDFGTTSPSLFMHGKTGLGKTHLSLAIAGAAVNLGFGVIYGSAQNLLNKLEREHFARNGDDTGNAEQAILDCDLLILDDLGTEFSTSFTVAAIYNIVNTRISRGLPVIINTNLTLEELEQKYTQRIISRIIGNYISLQFCGRDIRQLKLKH